MANVLSLGLAHASQELVRRNPIIIRAEEALKIGRIPKLAEIGAISNAAVFHGSKRP